MLRALTDKVDSIQELHMINTNREIETPEKESK